MTKTIDKKYLALIPKGKKRNTIVQFARELENEGKIPLDKISSHIVEVLREYTQKDYVRECLDIKYKVKYRVDNAQKRDFSRVSHAKQVSEKPIHSVLQAETQIELEKPITTREDSDQIARQRQVYIDHLHRRSLNEEERELLKLEIERRKQICNKIRWDKLDWQVYAAVYEYTEDESRVILEEAFRRFLKTKSDLNYYEKSYESLVNQHDKQFKEISRQFKICGICFKYTGKMEHRGDLLCDRCYNRVMKIDKLTKSATSI